MKTKLLVALVLLVAFARAETFETSFFKADVPTGWANAESDRTALVRFWTPADADPTANVKARIDVEAGRVSGGLGMDMFGYMQKDEAEQQYPNMPLKVSKEYRLGRSKGHRFEFVGKHNGKDSTMVQVFTIEGDRSYVVTYFSETSEWKRNSGAFETMVRSFSPR